MKHIVFLTALLSSFCTIHAAERLCACEDFSRLDPGTYQRSKTSVWDIRDENGVRFRRMENGGDVLDGWNFIDKQKRNYVLHIRFRILNEKNFGKLTFEFHCTPLKDGSKRGEMRNSLILNGSQLFFSAFKTKAFMTGKDTLPPASSSEIRPTLQQGVWYDLFLRVQGSRFSALLKEKDAVKGSLEAETLGESGTFGMRSEGGIDLALIESYAVTPD